jgi:uncharacterized protein (TIGR00730 family)
MRFCFIGSEVEREATRLKGIEVRAVAKAMFERFDTLVFGGSNIGIMKAFANAFAGCGGRVIAIAPKWLALEKMIFNDCELIWCEDLAARKRLMFDDVDAVLCYPGGLGTWDDLFSLLANIAVSPESVCPPIYIYNWEKFYAPMLLQIEVALELGLILPEQLTMIRPFESIDALSEQIRMEHGSGQR